MSALPNPVQAPENVHALLNKLHRLSEERESNFKEGYEKFASVERQLPNGESIYSRPEFDEKMKDQLIALDQDKSQFLYQLIRATEATKVVEAGTGWGVSTIYLALAVGQNASAKGEKGLVIATENEQHKANIARKHWEECGAEISSVIDLREGDILETLRANIPQIDLLLLDIWTPLALPTLKLIQPHLRRGAVVVADNTSKAANSYKDLLDYLRAEGSAYRNMTLPFSNGLEMCVYSP